MVWRRYNRNKRQALEQSEDDQDEDLDEDDEEDILDREKRNTNER
jgi:hypothetical protein